METMVQALILREGMFPAVERKYMKTVVYKTRVLFKDLNDWSTHESYSYTK